MNYFDPSGPVISIAATTTAPNGTQALSKNNVATPQVMVANASSNVGAIVGWGSTMTNAANAASSTLSPNQFYLAPLQQRIIVGSPDGFYSAITTTNSATIFAQPGIQG